MNIEVVYKSQSCWFLVQGGGLAKVVDAMRNWIKEAMHNSNKNREESKRNARILNDTLGK